jgi:hypothetical protein
MQSDVAWLIVLGALLRIPAIDTSSSTSKSNLGASGGNDVNPCRRTAASLWETV